MFLTRRNGIYYINHIDTKSNKYKRISTNTKNAREAFLFLESFQPKQSVTEKVVSLSLNEFHQEYITHLKMTHSPKYIDSINLSFRKLIEYFGDMELVNLQYRELEKFISFTFERSKSASSLYFRTLKAAFNKAVNWEYISESPMRKVKLAKLPKKLPLFINSGELNQIIDKATDPNMKEIFLIAFNTGMRLGELVNMKWSWVDLIRRTIILKQNEFFTTKGKRERLIPMNKIVYDILSAKFSNHNNVNSNNYIYFKGNNIKINEEYVSKNFKKALRKTNLDNKVHFHTLRHSFASNLVQKGANLYIIKELLGHEDIKTTQIYSHLTEQSLVDTINLLV